MKPQSDIVYEWTDEKDQAAILLAQGHTNTETANQVGVHPSTIGRWRTNEVFAKEVDDLTMMYGVASKLERIRLLNKAIRQKQLEDGSIDLSGVTFLDLIKEARMQTEGLRLGILEKIAAFDETAGPAPRIGSGRAAEILSKDTEEAD